MQQTYLSGSYFFYGFYLLCILRWMAITHKVRNFGQELQSTITRACTQVSKQANKQASKQTNKQTNKQASSSI